MNKLFKYFKYCRKCDSPVKLTCSDCLIGKEIKLVYDGNNWICSRNGDTLFNSGVAFTIREAFEEWLDYHKE